MCVFLAGAFIVTKGNGQAVLSVGFIGRAFKGFCFGGKVDCIYIKLIRPSRLRFGWGLKWVQFRLSFALWRWNPFKGSQFRRRRWNPFKGFCFGGLPQT